MLYSLAADPDMVATTAYVPTLSVLCKPKLAVRDADLEVKVTLAG